MARQEAIILFTGKLGNNIGYERNGKYFLRSASKAIRQTREPDGHPGVLAPVVLKAGWSAMPSIRNSM